MTEQGTRQAEASPWTHHGLTMAWRAGGEPVRAAARAGNPGAEGVAALAGAHSGACVFAGVRACVCPCVEAQRCPVL